jgi:hypothetical protein
MNRPLKREPTPPKQVDQSKQIVVAQTMVTLQQRVAPCLSHWGPPVSPPTQPMWGPYGVWVPYPSVAPMHHQQRWGETGSHDSQHSIFSQLNYGQSSSGSASQG